MLCSSAVASSPNEKEVAGRVWTWSGRTVQRDNTDGVGASHARTNPEQGKKPAAKEKQEVDEDASANSEPALAEAGAAGGESGKNKDSGHRGVASPMAAAAAAAAAVAAVASPLGSAGGSVADSVAQGGVLDGVSTAREEEPVPRGLGLGPTRSVENTNSVGTPAPVPENLRGVVAMGAFTSQGEVPREMVRVEVGGRSVILAGPESAVSPVEAAGTHVRAPLLGSNAGLASVPSAGGDVSTVAVVDLGAGGSTTR